MADENTGAKVGLIEETEPSPIAAGSSVGFGPEFSQALEETKRQVAAITRSASQQDDEAWEVARQAVERFRPVPWFVWRLAHYVLGRPGQIANVSDGLVFGFRRLLFAAASDATLGCGQKTTSVQQALKVLKPDVIAALAVVYGTTRRLTSCSFGRIYQPILDDALLRTQIGFMVGAHSPDFGSGRGMLAGFAGRSGIAVLMAQGTVDQAQSALEMLAGGKTLEAAGMSVYACDPLQVSALTLSASGCGRDAAFGTARYAAGHDAALLGATPAEKEQQRWLAAFTIIEKVRVGKPQEVAIQHWESLGFGVSAQRDVLVSETRKLVRNGHAWSWLIG